ncbi:MAG: hypothetical protein ACYDBB_15790 [Armatimonadota bacterium]
MDCTHDDTESCVAGQRRGELNGSIIFDNDALRLRVVPVNNSLGFVLEARGAELHWITLARMHTDHAVTRIAADGTHEAALFYAADPLEVHGFVVGATLSGRLGGDPVSLSLNVDPVNACCHFQVHITNHDAAPCRALTCHWLLSPSGGLEHVYWPQHALVGSELINTPAAFIQCGNHFIGLVPDIEEDERQLGLHLCLREQPELTFGLMASEESSLMSAREVRYGATMYFDVHALPSRGFQHLVRALGTHVGLSFAMASEASPVEMALPPLPDTSDASCWVPFIEEGSPEAIAAQVHACLRQADRGDFTALEHACCWLDRLCLHQYLYEVPGVASFGSIGQGPTWQSTALWMPILLLDAFRMSGIIEYANRGLLALCALPPADQSCVLGQLRPRFGDLYLNAEYGLALAVREIEVCQASFTPDKIELTLDVFTGQGPYLIVIEGVTTPLLLVVNGIECNECPISGPLSIIELPVILARNDELR